MILSAVLLAAGLTATMLRPCRLRDGRAPKLALSMLLLSTLAVWVGSFSMVVHLISGRITDLPIACGLLWRQLIAGDLSAWQVEVLVLWLVAFPLRGAAAVAKSVRAAAILRRGLPSASERMPVPKYAQAQIVRGLATPAITLGLRRPTILVDAEFWAGATPSERDVVLTHELAHCRGHHAWIEAAARFLVAGLAPLPAAAGVYECVRRHVEALADDAAAARHGRQAVGVTLGRIALAGFVPVTGLGAVGASLWRVHRLMEEPQPAGWHERLLLALLATAIFVVLLVVMAQSADALGHVASPRFCPLL